MQPEADKIIRVSLRRIQELVGANPDAPDGHLIKMALSDVQRLVREFNPDQPRDENGKWEGDGTSGSGGGADKPSGTSHHTAREKQAIEHYQKDGFEKMNSNLRHGKGVDAHGKVLDEAIARTQLVSDTTVYRGVGHTLTKQIVSLWEENGAATFVDKAFVSTSTSKKAAESFSKNMIEIRLPKGHNALSLANIGLENKHELEVLLGRGTKFNVTSARKTAVGYWRFKVAVLQ